MKDNKKTNKSIIKGALDIALKVEANSASCAVLYQPKEPGKISEYKIKK